MNKIDLLSCNLSQLKEMFKSWNLSSFRADQVFEWMYKGVDDFDSMTNLPLNLREELKEKCYIGTLQISKKLVSKDGTLKYLFLLNDNNAIESVRMHYQHGYSACISTQSGCRMGCSFCASTGASFSRNLTAGEIVGQLLSIQKDTLNRIGNIVLMGVGEPFDNYDNVLDFLKIVHEEKGLNIGYRKITISTCGLIPQMEKLIYEKIPVNLSISLHAPNDDIRRQIMPIARRYSIDKIIDTCKLYTKETGRRITFEYALISGINDDNGHALELVERIRGMLCHVNLIPLNVVDGGNYKKSTRHQTQQFERVLKNAGVPVSVRRELGSDIDAACGQLRKKQL